MKRYYKYYEKKEERHPNFDEVVRVLQHLNTLWKPKATIAYVLKCYAEAKKEQEADHEKKWKDKK